MKNFKKIILIIIINISYLAFVNYYKVGTLKFVLRFNHLYLNIKVIMSLMYRPYEYSKKSEPIEEKSVTAILPNFNEDPRVVIRAINSLLSQTYRIDQIIFVDDGSDDPFLYEKLKSIERKINVLEVYRFEKNKGKKSAQRFAFSKVKSDYILLFDTDSVLEKDSVYHLMAPFYFDENIGAVVGNIEINNRENNFIVRMQKLIYTSAFRLNRGAQSITGAVSVCSGAFSVYRFDIISNNLDKFKNKFGPFTVNSGDDRLLTSMILEENYKTVYQSNAICKTNVPTNTKTFIKQQIRWSKSGLILAVRSIIMIFKRPIVPFWQWVETYMWIFNWILLMVGVILGFSYDGMLSLGYFHEVVLYYLYFYFLSNIYVLEIDYKLYIYGFYYKIYYSLILFYIRFKALFTLHESKWSTR